MLKHLVLLLSWISLSLQSWPPSKDEYCILSCTECFWEITFGTTTSTDDYYTGYCQDTLRFESTWLCAKQRCTPREIAAGHGYLAPDCDRLNIAIPSYEATIANYSDEDIKNMQVFSLHEITSDTIVNNTLLPSDDLFYDSKGTWNTYLPMYIAHFRYAKAMYYFWMIVLLVGVVNRLFAAAVHYRLRKLGSDPEAGDSKEIPTKGTIGAIRKMIKMYITLPATFGYRHQQPFGWCTVPKRITSLMVFAFIVVNLILTSVVYHAFTPYLYDTSSAQQILGIVTDRAGVLAVANMPILWLFGGRNNILLWMTGWNFATYNSFHRWISRVVIIQVIIHSIGYTWIYLNSGGRAQLAEAYKEQFWYCGVMATIAFSFLWLFSFFPLRQRCYEIFLLTHIVLAAVALAGTFFHIRIYDGLYEPYLWPCVAFWVFDRVVRLGRLAVLNYKVAFGRHTKVLASYSAERDIIRLSVTPSFTRRPQPGAYYFIYFPTMLKALGNHPFTMATWTAGEKGTLPNPLLGQSPSGSIEKNLSSGVQTTGRETSSQSSGSFDTSDPATKLHFIIRPYHGLTSSLRDRILKSGHSSIELTALVEGPYGETHPLLTYNNIIFIAGGSGIAAVLPYMQQFLLGDRSQRTKRVHVIWAARQQTFVRDVLDHELAPAAVHPGVKLDLYVTGASPKPDKDKVVDLGRFDEDIGMRYARPSIPYLLPTEVRESVGSTAVLVCGPAQMADDARKASVEAVAEGHVGLGYFEEYFGW